MTKHPRAGIVGLLLLAVAIAASGGSPEADDRMTGEILTLLYVTDVRESVAFYEAVGFDHYYYYDYEADEYVLDWTQSYPSGSERVKKSIQGRISTSFDSATMPFALASAK